MRLEDLFETAEGVFGPGSRQTQPDDLTAAARQFEGVVSRCLGSRPRGVYRLALPPIDVDMA